MTKAGSNPEENGIVCPVCGKEVEVSAAFDADKKSLADFACNMQGKCGIPEWDPCPLYVLYRDKKELPGGQ